MRDFEEVIEDCHLSDLGFIGPKFTWSNGRGGRALTKERLDRALANVEWRSLFPNADVKVLAKISSDHHPVLVKIKEEKWIWQKKGKFKLEEGCCAREDYRKAIHDSWECRRGRADPWNNIIRNLQRCQKVTQVWVKKNLRASEDLIKAKTRELMVVQQEGKEEERSIEESLKKEIDGLLEEEDIKWQQRAKENWLRGGDRNTKYFHACASQRRRRNSVEKIRDEEGNICTNPTDIEDAFVKYYGELFTTAGSSKVDSCTSAIRGSVSNEMNGKLTATFTKEEVKQALDQMDPFKAPGPDGFTVSFYQKNWDTVGEEVCDAVLYFFNSCRLEGRINATNIALIPKGKTPRSVMDFRPISLCNVLYKLVSKVLANRLKVILPTIISPFQSAFLSGRLITDNIIAAYETLHTMHTKMWSKVGFMGIKLDMSKAYDRVEWDFLETVMWKMGFSERWIRLIMECIRTVSYSVIVNGQAVGNIKPTRGIRQGDPLSPYLFLICAEALSSMLSRAESKGVIIGVPTSKKGPRLSHLFFADDSLLFCKANLVEWRRLMRLLEDYEAASGQKLNKEKTSIFFSRNTSEEKKDEISRLSGLSATQCYEKYLGLPTMVGRSKYKAFKSIKDRVWSRLNDWKVKFLSQAGKEILIKAVVQAIPTYCMSVFLLPTSLCKELNSLMQRFWWGHKENISKIHWMSWEKLGASKDKGGLGFRDLTMFNKALLAKQLWRMVENPESLVASIMKAKYFSNCSIMEASVGSRPSLVWRSILASKELVEDGVLWRIGDGRSVKIWGDKWLPMTDSSRVQSPKAIQLQDMTVGDLINREEKQWRSPLINSLFLPEEATTILNIPLSPYLPKDRLIWKGTKNGVFTVRSAYHLGMERRKRLQPGSSGKKEIDEMWKICWRLHVPNAVKMHLWRACQNLLPTKANLFRRGVCDNNLCPIYMRMEEAVGHACWDCPAAQDVWGGCRGKLQKCGTEGRDFVQIFEEVSQRCDKDEVELFAVVSRKIWLRRNGVVHGESFTHPTQLLKEAEIALGDFHRCSPLGGGKGAERVREQVSWQPPFEDIIKINWDAALDSCNKRVGMGIIARDCRGGFLAATNKL
jgi:hypothetical protein